MRIPTVVEFVFWIVNEANRRTAKPRADENSLFYPRSTVYGRTVYTHPDDRIAYISSPIIIEIK